MLEGFRHFVLIVEEGTFTRAARRAHLSQPALTASIQRLESDVGARLLERGRLGAELTAAGEALLPRARAALAAVEDARRAVLEVANVHAGEVRLGAGATACTYLLPPALAAFRARHPRVRLKVREAATPEVLEALESGQLDLGVVTYPPPPGTLDHPIAVEVEPWFVDELVVVASSALARPEEAPFITFPPGSTSRDLLDRTFPGADIAMELGSIAAVKGNVRAGIGVALVSRSALAGDLRTRRLVVVPHRGTPVKRPLHVVHRGVDRLPPAAAALRGVLMQTLPAPSERREPAPGGRHHANERAGPKKRRRRSGA